MVEMKLIFLALKILSLNLTLIWVAFSGVRFEVRMGV